MVKYLRYKTTLILATVVAMLCLPMSVQAANKTCLTDEILQVNHTYYIDVDGTITPISVSKEIYCRFGCSESLNECRWDEFNSYLITFFMLLLILGIGVVGIRYAGYYSPVVLMLILTLTLSIYLTDVFTNSNRLLILIVSIALIAMNLDEYLKYREWKKYDKPAED